MNALAAFSSITVHNCCISNADGEPIPLTLSVSMSFPAPRYDQGKDASPLSASWDALSPPTSAGHLDLIIEPTMMGEGRIGLAYSARVNAATDAEGNDISGHRPAEVCLKIAKPTYCRSLAREAWFYEQLQEWQGVATAKCYGFFTVPVPPDTSVRPWNESNELPHKFHPRDYFGINYPSADWLPDDPPSCHHMFSQDSFDFVEGSSWHKWTPKEDKQEIAILILEKLGPHYYSEDDEPQADREALRESVRNVVDDICFTGVLYEDITAYNILRAPLGEQAFCEKHQTSHDWRLVDFDRCYAVDRYSSDVAIIGDMRFQKTTVGCAAMCFWGGTKD